MEELGLRIGTDINNCDNFFEPKAGEILWKMTDTNMKIPVLVRDISGETGNYGKYLLSAYFTNKAYKSI